MEKHEEYAVKLISKIQELFNEEDDNFINVEEFNERGNANSFFHALATLMPLVVFNHLTNDHKNNLEFNHIANQLCFEFTKIKSKP